MKKIFKILVIILAVFILFVFLNNKNKQYTSQNYPIISHSYEKINIIGEISNKGVYDPTVEYDSDGSVGWLIYSALEQPPEDINSPYIKYIHTDLAKTTDNGKTWTFVKRLTESVPGVVDSPLMAQIYKIKNPIKGMWHNEVPTLVYDPDDKDKEWKLFWHKYFSADMPTGKDRPRILSHSWIMMKEADSPENLDKAEEVKMFGTKISPGAKFSFEEETGDLGKITTYSEPGSLYWQGKIYVILSYFGTPNAVEKMILISSDDNGKTWQYRGKLLEGKDAFGTDRNFWGAALAEENGRVFLLTPPITKKGTYLGTYVFEFENLDRAKLKRDKKGVLIPVKYFKRSLKGNINSGQADYNKFNTYGGLIMSQADVSSAPKIGQLFSTKEDIINGKVKKH
jgi:uncharacterized protein YxeA